MNESLIWRYTVKHIQIVHVMNLQWCDISYSSIHEYVYVYLDQKRSTSSYTTSTHAWTHFSHRKQQPKHIKKALCHFMMTIMYIISSDTIPVNKHSERFVILFTVHKADNTLDLFTNSRINKYTVCIFKPH